MRSNIFHSKNNRHLKCTLCKTISEEVSKSNFDTKNYCIDCLVSTIAKNIINQNSEYKKPDFS